MNRLSESAPAPMGGSFSRFEWDVARGHAVMHLADGTSVGMPVTLPITGEGIGIARMAYSFADHTLTITTLGGECATMEIEPPGSTSQCSDSRVVYLDQCHWSTLARRIHDPDSMTDRDLLGRTAVAVGTLAGTPGTNVGGRR